MKKAIILTMLLVASSFTFTSCTKEESVGSSSTTSCYKFTIKQTTTCTPYVEGVNSTVTSYTENCGLTSTQAQEVCDSMKSTSTSYSGGYTIKITTTCTYVKIQ
jgi:hypothetical protein